MKKTNNSLCILIASLFLIAGSVVAAVSGMDVPFSGWKQLAQHSPDIVITRCTSTPSQQMMLGGAPSDIEIKYILKGETNSWDVTLPKLGASKLDSEYCPRQGECYLVFSIFHDGVYQAIKPYRIIPLGQNFDTNVLSGKTLDEQIQMLLQKRLNDLNRQMKAEQEEKARLEEAFQK